MSLYDSAKSQIKILANASINSNTIIYGFIGLTTGIISYYTFFENDIEVPQSSPITSSPILGQQSSPILGQPSSPITSSPSIFGQQGGKRKKTRRQKQ
jgi:hypothetical protein